jgi:uncharacterized cupredoxin-like copper-binding protein
MSHRLPRATALVAVMLLVGSLVVGLRPTRAQEETITHPAHIHQGTCAALGDVAYPLQDVAPVAPTAGMPAAAEGATTAVPVAMSVTTVDVKLTDLLSAPYAINVHESMQEIEDYIACGDIGGRPVGGDLLIGLHLLGTYGYAGIAILHAEGDQTTVTIYLAEVVVAVPTHAAGLATPVAGPGTVAITEREMEISAAQTTFKVGQPYTFIVTNAGTTDHELVIEHRGDVDKPLRENGQEAEAPDIAPGQTKTLTWTFTEPGDYQFACHLPGHFEAGMILPITVTP